MLNEKLWPLFYPRPSVFICGLNVFPFRGLLTLLL
jgi:hypothetical protein